MRWVVALVLGSSNFGWFEIGVIAVVSWLIAAAFRGAHPARLSELPVKFLPKYSFAPAPIKRKVDGGEVMKGMWSIDQGSRRTDVAMR